MPSCVALGCQRGRGEAVLKVFPRKDRLRRQIWVDRVNRPGWTPTKYSALCENHFDRDQWELPREDGKRKLKDSALPTVFVVPPPVDSKAALKDHPYCLPFYRKLYEDGDSKAGTPEQGGGTIPIEHVKVEVGECGDFTPETVEEEEEEENNEEGGGGREEELDGVEEEAESIQCTPDISVFPEHGEPFPIEMVDCENDDINAFSGEPDNDPLAISAEDKVQVATTQLYFGNSQKFLFIPKDTKVMMSVPSKAVGEPQVNSAGSASPPVVKPTLKVKNLDGLLDPNAVFKPSSSNSARVNDQILLRSPSAVYLKEKSTLSDNPVTSSQKLKPIAPRKRWKKLQVDQKIVTLTSPTFNFPPNLKITSTTDAAPPKLNLVSKELTVQKDQDFVRKTTNLTVEKPVVLPSRPNILIRNPDVSKMLSLSNANNNQVRAIHKAIQSASRESSSQLVLTDENIKSSSKPGNDLNTPQLIAERILKRGTIGGKLGSGNGSDEKNGNNNTTAATKKPSVIVLKPFGSYKSLKVNTGGNSNKNVSNIKTSQVENQSVTMYECDQCQNCYMSAFALQVHKHTSGHVRRKSQEENHVEDKDVSDKEVVIVETSESSDDSQDSESEDDSSVVLLSENDSGTDDGQEISGCDDSSTDESDSETDTAEEVKVAKKRHIVVKSSLNKSPKQFESSLFQISDVSALSKLKSHEFLRLSSVVNSRNSENLLKSAQLAGKGSIKRKRKSEAVSYTEEETLDEDIDENDGRTEENRPTPRVKLTRENLLRRTNVLQKQKIDHSKTRQVSRFIDDSEEQELIVISSSSSSSSSSNCDSGDDVFSSDGEDSEEEDSSSTVSCEPVAPSEEDSSRTVSCEPVAPSEDTSRTVSCEPVCPSEEDTSSTHSHEAGSPSKEDVGWIKKLIVKKKKLMRNEKKDCILEPPKVNKRKPIALLPRDPMKINKLKRAYNCRIPSPESSSEIVISDDEEQSCRQNIILDENNENSVTILNVNVNRDKVREKIPAVENVSKEDILVDLTLADECEIKKTIMNRTPIVLLPKLNLDDIKRKIIVDTNRERVNIEINNVTKSKENELITGGKKKISCVKRKIKEKTSSNVNVIESKTKNIVVRSNGKHSRNEKHKTPEIISQRNRNRTNSRKSLNVERESEDGSEFNLNKTSIPVKRVKMNEEKYRNINNYEKSPNFQTRKCKLCGDIVRKSQFKQHVYQHTETNVDCKVCKRTFPRSVSLRRHMKNEHS